MHCKRRGTRRERGGEVTSAELMPFEEEMNKKHLLRLHLVEEGDEKEYKTDEEDKKLDTKIVACLHCTGFDRIINKKSIKLQSLNQ